MPSLLHPYLMRHYKQPSDNSQHQTYTDLTEFILQNLGFSTYVFPGVRLSASEPHRLLDVTVKREDAISPPNPCTLDWVRENIAIQGRVYISPIGPKEEKKWHGIARAAAMDRILGVKMVNEDPNSTLEEQNRPVFKVRLINKNSLSKQQQLESAVSHRAPLSISIPPSPSSPKQTRRETPKKNLKKKTDSMITGKTKNQYLNDHSNQSTTANSNSQLMLSPIEKIEAVMTSHEDHQLFGTYQPNTGVLRSSVSDDEARQALEDTPSYISLRARWPQAAMTWKPHYHSKMINTLARESQEERAAICQDLPIDRLNIKQSDDPIEQIEQVSPVPGLRLQYFSPENRKHHGMGLFTASEMVRRLDSEEDGVSSWLATMREKRNMMRQIWIDENEAGNFDSSEYLKHKNSIRTQSVISENSASQQALSVTQFIDIAKCS
ncbi:hypothetical protein V1511DRAFT_460774 [Dipodascopsis uninucleata]